MVIEPLLNPFPVAGTDTTLLMVKAVGDVIFTVASVLLHC